VQHPSGVTPLLTWNVRGPEEPMAVFVPDSYEVDGLRRLRSALLDSHSAVVWNRTVVEEPPSAAMRLR